MTTEMDKPKRTAFVVAMDYGCNEIGEPFLIYFNKQEAEAFVRRACPHRDERKIFEAEICDVAEESHP